MVLDPPIMVARSEPVTAGVAAFRSATKKLEAFLILLRLRIPTRIIPRRKAPAIILFIRSLSCDTYVEIATHSYHISSGVESLAHSNVLIRWRISSPKGW
ncbi:hypothetical protein ES708_34394 [subsurface metagenome]